MNALVVPKHIHKYIRTSLSKRRKSNGANIFKCVIPGCTHFVMEGIVEGRPCECWVCGELFLINRKSMKLKKPHCDNCYSRSDLRGKPTRTGKLEESKKDWSQILDHLKGEGNAETE